MKTSQESAGESEAEFEQALQDVERALADVKERYEQVKRDRVRQAELGHRREDIRREQGKSPLPEFKAELRQIQQELETIELNLESSLFSWGSLKAPFWQAVRFGGVGIIIGWVLKSLAG
jgi:DNA repair exonuclease SbcCD ATPase subunit